MLLNNINETISEQDAEAVYEYACGQYYADNMDQAEKIFSALYKIENLEIAHVRDRSIFNLSIIAINKQDYETASFYLDNMEFPGFNNTFFINYLFKIHCSKKILDQEFQKKFGNNPVLKKHLETTAAVFYEEKNNIKLSTIDKLNIENIIKEKITLSLQKIIENYITNYHDSVLASTNACLLGYHELELEFIAGIPTDKIDYPQLENHFLQLLDHYLTKKIIHIKTIDKTLSNISNDKILIHLLTHISKFSQTLIAFALFNKIDDKDLLNTEQLKYIINNISHLNFNKTYETIFRLYLKKSSGDYSEKLKYALMLILNYNDENINEKLDEASALIKNIISAHNKYKDRKIVISLGKAPTQLEFQLSLLALQYILAVKNYKNIADHLDINIKNVILSLNKIMREYSLEYQTNLPISENIQYLLNKIQSLANTDIRITFLERFSNLVPIQ